MPKRSAIPGTISEPAAPPAARQRPVAQSLNVEDLSSGGSGDNYATLHQARGTKRALPMEDSGEDSDEEVLPSHPWYAPTLSSVLAAFGNRNCSP